MSDSNEMNGWMDGCGAYTQAREDEREGEMICMTEIGIHMNQPTFIQYTRAEAKGGKESKSSIDSESNIAKDLGEEREGWRLTKMQGGNMWVHGIYDPWPAFPFLILIMASASASAAASSSFSLCSSMRARCAASWAARECSSSTRRYGGRQDISLAQAS